MSTPLVSPFYLQYRTLYSYNFKGLCQNGHVEARITSYCQPCPRLCLLMTVLEGLFRDLEIDMIPPQCGRDTRGPDATHEAVCQLRFDFARAFVRLHEERAEVRAVLKHLILTESLHGDAASEDRRSDFRRFPM